VTIDTELETWRREWQAHSDPLPEWKKKIERQNLRTVVAVIFACICLIFAALEARRHPTPFMLGLNAGLWFSCALAGGYSWWVRRGSWKPTAQTTLAYVELAHKRAVAKARTLRFCFYFLLITILAFAGLGAWDWKALTARDAAIVGGIILELLFFRYYERRKRQEIERTRKLMEQIQEETYFNQEER
jgi:hypothetical protein